MNAPLDGLTLVVTRPAAQAGPFLALAGGAGAHCLAFPTLEIERLALTPPARAAVLAAPWDWAIYTSTNAVEAAFAELGPLPAQHLAAVGRATARALEQRGLAPRLRPGSANSEGLLALPDLQDVAGQRVLLVKGAGGRDLLRATLEARGAHVETVELYRRAPARPSPESAEALLAALASRERRLVVAVTSVEVLEALLALVPVHAADRLRTAALLVPGARVAGAARDAGWTGTVVQAATAEDHAMLEALVAWAGGPSRAA